MTLKTVSAFAAAAASSLALAFAAGSALAQDALTHDPAAVKSGDYVLDPDHGKITFSVVHMGYSVYQGQFTGVQAKLHLDAAHPSASTLDATVPVDGIATGNAHLDAHLKTADFFDLAKFPNVAFHATKIDRTGPKTARITGDLTLLGVTHPVTLEAEFLQAGKQPFFGVYEVGFAAHGELKRSEWGMTKFTSAPNLPGFVPVSDEVKLQFEGEFKAAQ
jgi:polyisoprenoid-binding protein YceI